MSPPKATQSRSQRRSPVVPQRDIACLADQENAVTIIDRAIDHQLCNLLRSLPFDRPQPLGSPANNPKRRRAVVPRPDFAVLAHGKVVEFLDAKYRDLWETPLPRDMLYQLAIYALSKNTGLPRSTILYPTLAGEAADQAVRLKDPVLGNKRAEIILRPVNLLGMERLVRPRQGALGARRRREFARTLVFGDKRTTQLQSIISLAS
jgi:hypothetical protein